MNNKAIDAETLAAFLDGRLSATQRAEVMKRLAQSPEDYDLFIEAAAVRNELEKGETSALPAVARWRWSRPAVWVPLAAVLAGALLVPIAIRSSQDTTSFGLLDPGSVTLRPDWQTQPWTVTRGSGRTLAEEQLAFRIGVRAAQLDLAWSANDPAGAARAAGELIPLIRQLDASGPIAASFTEMSGAADQPRSAPSEGARKAAFEELGDFLGNSAWFDLGVWLEQARIAAPQHPAFFAGDTARLFNRIADRIENAPSALDAELRALRQIMVDGVTTDEVPALRTLIDSISRTAAG